MPIQQKWGCPCSRGRAYLVQSLCCLLLTVNGAGSRRIFAIRTFSYCLRQASCITLPSPRLCSSPMPTFSCCVRLFLHGLDQPGARHGTPISLSFQSM
ncbi:hypothetical protein FKM82_015837 [Ascaphus truei]